MHGAVRRRGRDRAAHALPENVERTAGIGLSQDLAGGDRIERELPFARPQSTPGRPAEAALIVCVGGDTALGPQRGWGFEGVAVIAKAVQRQDHRLWLALRQPFA